MITASENFISKVSQTSRRFTARFLFNGAEVTCDVKTVKIYKGACGDAFLPGSVYSSYIESVVDNLTANIENKELELQIGLYLADGTVEYVPVGLYTVTKPKISAYQTTFIAVGRIASRLSVIFSPPSEKTIAKIAEAITAQTGVNITLKGITASGTIQQNLAGLTCRDVLEIIASVLGGFATEDSTGGIIISKFSADVTAEYTCERMLELPTFNEYDYSVSGVKVIVSDASEDEDGGEIEEVSFTSGDPKLIIKNPYMTAELFTAFTANLTGFTYRPGTVPLSLGDPRIEPWDCIRVIDVKGDSMIVPCMNIVHSFDGGLSTTISAPGDSESGADASNKGPATKAIERMAAELLTAEQAIIKRLKADEAELTYAKITMLDAESARIDSIAGDLSSYKEYVGEKFTGLEGDFQELDSVTLKTKDLSAEVAKLGYATIESLNVQTGRIDSLSGEYSEFKTTVTEQFSAVNAEIAETLKTKNLAAEVAKLGYVEADTLNAKIAEFGYITAGSADLKYAAIGDFDAVKGRVGILEGSFSSFVSGEFGTLKSGVADIQTLIFGSATGSTITTEFANSVVSHIGDAQIHSGMIKELDFEKIKGLDIDTTKVTVHSQDGKSHWKDNTIQISDANRVRVQIGKDAEGDYNMYVWDASGKLMFDACGLTGDGIQREIIRNDMVAADANIDGSKINIQSVVSYIDESTYTLSSSHLLYDGTSLDLFLGSMSETVTEQGSTLSSQGTKIETIQGQITSKVWQQDIDTAKGEMSTQYSSLEQSLNGFKTEVSNTYSTKLELGDVDKKAGDAQSAANTNAKKLTDFINATTLNIEDLQSQIDGSITTHFYEYEPTNTNIPASEWTTVDLKSNHLGDLFYDTITGYCYRWQVANNEYSWNRITDVDVTKALADAANAQTTANSKRRVFVVTPTPPYDIGDLWVQGETGDIMKCKIAKTEIQSYTDSDWEKASKYTDDTRADEAYTKAEQTADKFTWIVKSGTNSTDFTLTDRVASLLSSEFQIDALTTFKNSAIDGTSTVINGGAIKTGTIEADRLNVTDLNAIGATIGGFTIGNSAIYNGATSLAGADNSVYLGLDGISCGTKFKVDKKGVLSTADIKMEKTNTEDGITSTFGTYISSPETWTGSGLAVPEIKTKTETVVDGVTYSDTLTMYPFRISLEKYVTGTDNTWLRLEPTKLSMFSYITTNGFKVPELFIQPAGANSLSSVTLGKEAHQIYSVKWTDDPYDYPDDPLASCPHEMYPIDINASTVTFNSAVVIKNQGLELYHATPYIDFHFGNSDADYTSRIIESKSGTLQAECNLNITGDIGAANLTRKSVTISGLPSGAGYTCYYYPVLKMCFLRLYYTGKAVSATTTTVLGTVASGYRPTTQHALAVYPLQDTLKHRQASISSDGGIKFYSEVAKASGDDIYISGFWYV